MANTLSDNPYSPASIQEPRPEDPKSAWRIILALFLIVLGATVLVYALGLAAEVVLTPARSSLDTFNIVILAICTSWMLAGIAWIVSGCLFWRGRYRRAVVTAAVVFVLLGLEIGFFTANGPIGP